MSVVIILSRKLVLISNMQKNKSMMMMYYPNVLNIDDCNITEDQNSCLKICFCPLLYYNHQYLKLHSL